MLAYHLVFFSGRKPNSSSHAYSRIIAASSGISLARYNFSLLMSITSGLKSSTMPATLLPITTGNPSIVNYNGPYIFWQTLQRKILYILQILYLVVFFLLRYQLKAGQCRMIVFKHFCFKLNFIIFKLSLDEINNGKLYFLFINFMQTSTSFAQIYSREDTIDVDHILRMMNFGDQLITPGKNTTEVIFLGPMRSGKSTLMSFFGGSKLYSIGSTKKTYSIDSNGDPEDILRTKSTQIYKEALKQMKIQETDRTISSEGVACTVIPMRTAGFAEGISYWDTPGFGDNRGVEFDLLNGYFIKKVFDINQQVSTKLCLVISYHQIQVATGSKTIVPTLKQFHKTFSEIPNYYDSLMVVVTATRPNQDIESVLAHLQEFKNNFEQKDSPKELYNYIMNHPKILLLMQEPDAQKQDIKPYYEKFRNSFLQTIEKQIKPLKSSNIATPIDQPYLEQINFIIRSFKNETNKHITEFIKTYETEFQKAALVEQKVQEYEYSVLEKKCNYLKLWRSYNDRLRQLVKAQLDESKLREIRKKFQYDSIKLLDPTKKQDNDGIISFLDLLYYSTINTTKNEDLLSLIIKIKNKFIALRFLSMTTLKGSKKFQAPNTKHLITQFIDKIKSSLNNKITKIDENFKKYIFDYLKFFTPLKIYNFLEQFKRDSYYGKWRKNGEFLTNFMCYVSNLNSPKDQLDEYIKKIDYNKGYFGFQKKAQSLQQLSKTVYLIRGTVGNNPEVQNSLTLKCKEIFLQKFLVEEMGNLSKYRPSTNHPSTDHPSTDHPSTDHLGEKLRFLPPYYKNDVQYLNGNSSVIQKDFQKITSQNAQLNKQVTELNKEVTKLKNDIVSQKKDALRVNQQIKDNTCCKLCCCTWSWCCIS